MPLASFRSEESKKAFYEKYNKKNLERYYSDPEFRAKKLAINKEAYYRQKELGIGKFAKKKADVAVVTVAV